MIFILQQQTCLSLSEHSPLCLNRATKQGTLLLLKSPLLSQLEHAATSSLQLGLVEDTTNGEVAKATCGQGLCSHVVQAAWAGSSQPEAHLGKEDGSSPPLFPS